MDEAAPEITQDQREALEELTLYLSDSIPPLIFAGSAELLLQTPPHLVAAQIVAWAMNQGSPGSELYTVDFLFHAAKKIHMLAELELVSGKSVNLFLAQLRPHLLEGCPPRDRGGLAHDLDRLDLEVSAGPKSAVDVVYRRSGRQGQAVARARPRSGDNPGGQAQDEELREMSRTFGEGLKKLDLLLTQVDVSVPAANMSDSSGPDRRDAAATAVSEAANSLQSSQEMEQFLEGLKERGLPSADDGLLGMLAGDLPDWAPPPAGLEDDGDAPQAAVRAMRSFISLAKNQEESQRRFDELVDTAVGEFNKESLGRAVTLLDLAGSMVSRKEVDAVFATSVQRRVCDKIDRSLLRELADSEEKHHLLRRFLAFFKEFEPEQLLEALEDEESRDQRRFLINLLIVVGPAAREAVVHDLSEASVGNAVFPWYYRRNLIRVLRKMPRLPGEDLEPEIDLLVSLCDPSDPFPLFREALTALGQLHHERTAAALSARIIEIEEALLGQCELQHEPDQLLAVMDSTLKLLVRMENPEARRCLVAHGLRRRAELGDTLERLTWLADQDLSGEPDLVDRLVREAREELPKKMFGVTLKKSGTPQLFSAVVQTLSSTDTPAVRELLSDLGRGFSGEPFARLATRTLKRMSRAGGKRKPAGHTLSGDLELFGLPNLLQNLSESQIGGLLTVYGRGEDVVAEMWLEEGRVLGARAGRLRGEVAVYQVLEDPAPGRFELASSSEAIPLDAKTQANLPIQSVLFEGMRRYDEFKRAASTAPDNARYRHSGGQPTLPRGESDVLLFKDVWRLAAAGRTPAECEQRIAVDRFRVRCLFEHWVDEGVLVATSPDNAPP